MAYGRYFYSEQQSQVKFSVFARTLREMSLCLGDDGIRETRCFVIMPVEGEMVEVEYTEMYSGPDLNYRTNWPDAVFIGEGEFDIRVEYIDA